ncbi:hypothetical protein ABIG04_009291 [Bradyrhizobium japonicum]
MTLSEHLPADIREVMDAYVGDLRPQPWRIRFLLLIDLLQEKWRADPPLSIGVYFNNGPA